MSIKKISAAPSGDAAPAPSQQLAVADGPVFVVAREHAQAANLHADQATWHALQCGLELLRIKAALGETRGKKPQAAVFLKDSWADTVQREVGISDDTARRWMHMAKGGLSKLEIEPEKFLALPEPRREKAVEKLRTMAEKAESQSDFIRELYGLKPPPGFALQGNDLKREKHKATKRRRTKTEMDEARMESAAAEWFEWGFLSIRDAYLNPKESWHGLTDVPLSNLADVLKRFSDEVDQVCRARGIQPAKLADWQNQISEK